MTDEKKKRNYYPPSHNRLSQAYNKAHMTRISVALHNVSDIDIIEKLNSVPNKVDYIRQLIRADINKNTD